MVTWFSMFLSFCELRLRQMARCASKSPLFWDFWQNYEVNGGLGYPALHLAAHLDHLLELLELVDLALEFHAAGLGHLDSFGESLEG